MQVLAFSDVFLLFESGAHKKMRNCSKFQQTDHGFLLLKTVCSSNNIDACAILPSIRNGSNVVSPELGLQIDKILLQALGHQGGCPIQPETVVLRNEHVTLQEIPATLGAIASVSTVTSFLEN